MKQAPSSLSEPERPALDLRGHLLIAMPGMTDERFDRSVVLITAHSKDGAMGFVLNKRVVEPTFIDILEELDLDMELQRQKRVQTPVDIFSGGPVEQGRGFVIHSFDYASPASTRIADLGAVTATLDVLRAIAGPRPPERFILLLGYAGWDGGQLEAELAQNAWLSVPATRELLFETAYADRYAAALAALGISEELLSAQAGHA